MASIDLNSDVGEGFGLFRSDTDAAVLDHVTSANIACGMHAGDPQIIRSTINLAKRRGVAIGAHPGFHDLQGGGRREIRLSSDDLYSLVVYQVGAVQAFAKAADTRLSHVKIHGAMYNMAARDPAMARVICEAVSDVDRSLVFVGLAGSHLVRAARETGLVAAEEVFADRTYQDDGSLTPRGHPLAMIVDVEQSIAQVMRMVRSGVVRSINGVDVQVQPDTLCIHGDQPHAAQFAQEIRRALIADGVAVHQLASTPISRTA